MLGVKKLIIAPKETSFLFDKLRGLRNKKLCKKRWKLRKRFRTFLFVQECHHLGYHSNSNVFKWRVLSVSNVGFKHQRQSRHSKQNNITHVAIQPFRGSYHIYITLHTFLLSVIWNLKKKNNGWNVSAFINDFPLHDLADIINAFLILVSLFFCSYFSCSGWLWFQNRWQCPYCILGYPDCYIGWAGRNNWLATWVVV